MNANAAANDAPNAAPNAAPNTDANDAPNAIDVLFTSIEETLLSPIFRSYAPRFENNECKYDLHTWFSKRDATVPSSEGRQLSCPLHDTKFTTQRTRQLQLSCPLCRATWHAN